MLARAPRALAVGDLHVENFGTWRDVEGRLIWGINDFDEAWRLPYTNDLVRLATSALLAEMGCDPEDRHRRHPEGLCGSASTRAAGPSCWPSITARCASMATARLHDAGGVLGRSCTPCPS